MKKKNKNELKVNFDLPSTLSAVSRPAVMAGLAWTFNYFTTCFSLMRCFQGRCILCCQLLPKQPCFLEGWGCLPFCLPCGACFRYISAHVHVCHRIAMNDGAATLAAALQALAVPRLLMWYQLLPAPGDKPLLHLTVTSMRWYVGFKIFLGKK